MAPTDEDEQHGERGPLALAPEDRALDPVFAAELDEAMDAIEAGEPTVDGPTWAAGWKARLDAKWPARTG